MKKYFLFTLTLMGLFVLIFQISKTYSLFESSITNSADISLASWKIKVGDTYLTSLTSEDEEFDLTSINWSNANHVREGKGAPGSSGSFDVIIDPLTTDTSFLYEIVIDTEIFNESGLKITSVSEVDGHEFSNTGENTYQGIAHLKEIKNKEKYDIKIELVWEDNEDNNSADYELGSKADTKINLPIHVNIYQYNSKEG